MQDAYDLVVLLLDTGARYSEIAKIGWSKIDLKQREIHLWRPKVATLSNRSLNKDTSNGALGGSSGSSNPDPHNRLWGSPVDRHGTKRAHFTAVAPSPRPAPPADFGGRRRRGAIPH